MRPQSGPTITRRPASLPIRFVEAMCGADCEIRCGADERIMNVMPMAPTERYAFELHSANFGIYDGPDKGVIKVMVVCTRR